VTTFCIAFYLGLRRRNTSYPRFELLRGVTAVKSRCSGLAPARALELSPSVIHWPISEPMSFLHQQRSSYARGSHMPAQRDAMRAAIVAAAFDDVDGACASFLGATSPEFAEWSSGSDSGACAQEMSDKPNMEQPSSRKRSAGAAVERPTKRSKCSPCGIKVRLFWSLYGFLANSSGACGCDSHYIFIHEPG
jgi:hypothetical protein